MMRSILEKYELYSPGKYNADYERMSAELRKIQLGLAVSMFTRFFNKTEDVVKQDE